MHAIEVGTWSITMVDLAATLFVGWSILGILWLIQRAILVGLGVDIEMERMAGAIRLAERMKINDSLEH
jgi:hypothetical protein